jgi:hypothetical protein
MATVHDSTGKRRKRAAIRWSYSAGERGRNRVRVFDRGVRGLYLDYFDDAGVRVRTSLKHSDREKAKQQADKVAAQFREHAVRPARFTLALLFDMYDQEVSRHKPSESKRKRKHDARCEEMFLRFFGADMEPKALSRREWDRFIPARRSGALRPATVEKPRPVGDRMIEYDLKHLLAILNWAMVAGDGKGSPIPERNPLKGMPLPSEKNPKRAVLSDDQYDTVLGKADQVHPLVRSLLVIAHETGHRIGSIRQLCWDDVDLKAASVSWIASHVSTGVKLLRITGENCTLGVPACRRML